MTHISHQPPHQLCPIHIANFFTLELCSLLLLFTKQKRKQLEDILGVVGKPVKKAKSGTGHEKPVDTVPYHSLLYGCQDLLQLGSFTKPQLRLMLRRACYAHCEHTGKTLKVKESFDSSDDESNLRLGLQLAWFKKPLDSTVSVDTVEVYEPSEVGYTKDEIGRD